MHTLEAIGFNPLAGIRCFLTDQSSHHGPSIVTYVSIP